MSIYMIGLIAALVGWTCINAFKLASLIKSIDDAKRWVKVDAIVKDVVVLKKKEALDRKTLGNKRAFIYAQYWYDDREFGATNIGIHEKERAVDRLYLSSIKKEDKITIYVNPEAPHQSIVLPPEKHSYMGRCFYFMLSLSISLMVALVCASS